MRIKDIKDREDLVLFTDSQDVEPIKECLRESGVAKFDLECVDGFFVKLAEFGEYLEIFGFNGIIPDLHKELYRLY